MSENKGKLYTKLKPFGEKCEGEFGSLNGEYGCAKEIEKILDEVKRDFGLDRLIFSKEQMEQQLRDGSLTQVEKAFVETALKLIKWFGDA